MKSIIAIHRSGDLEKWGDYPRMRLFAHPKNPNITWVAGTLEQKLRTQVEKLYRGL